MRRKREGKIKKIQKESWSSSELNNLNEPLNEATLEMVHVTCCDQNQRSIRRADADQRLLENNEEMWGC